MVKRFNSKRANLIIFYVLLLVFLNGCDMADNLAAPVNFVLSKLAYLILDTPPTKNKTNDSKAQTNPQAYPIDRESPQSMPDDVAMTERAEVNETSSDEPISEEIVADGDETELMQEDRQTAAGQMSQPSSQFQDDVKKGNNEDLQEENLSDAAVQREAFTYSGGNRRDPFQPLVADDQTKELDKLSSFKLTGIIWNNKNNLAMFEDSEGNGYFFNVGDKIGNATVASITKDTVLFQVHEFGVVRKISLTLTPEE